MCAGGSETRSASEPAPGVASVQRRTWRPSTSASSGPASPAASSVASVSATRIARRSVFAGIWSAKA